MTEDFRGLRPRRGRPRCGSPRDVVGTLDRRAHREAQRGAAQRAAEVALLVDTRRISRRTGARPPQHAAAPICSGVGACSTSWSCSRAPPVSWASVQRGPSAMGDTPPSRGFFRCQPQYCSPSLARGKSGFWRIAVAVAARFGNGMSFQHNVWQRNARATKASRSEIKSTTIIPCRGLTTTHCKISGALGD